jgi:hypothetical protein
MPKNLRPYCYYSAHFPRKSVGLGSGMFYIRGLRLTVLARFDIYGVKHQELSGNMTRQPDGGDAKVQYEPPM